MFATLILLVFAASSINQLGALSEFQSVNVGVVLDFNSSIGYMADKCLSIAINDFYDLNYDYKTRVVLQKKHSEDAGSTALSVLDLLESDKVVAIIGSQSLTEAVILIEIGRTFQVPVITFSVPSISISPSKSPYFIRTAQNDSYQVQALAELIRGFNCHEIVLIYEDTIDGKDIIPYLTEELLASDIKITYKCAFVKEASYSQIYEELDKMRALRTQVFLVHIMTTSLASRIFDSANDIGIMNNGLMRQGSYWIITDGLSNSIDDSVRNEWTYSMKGVIGIRPYIPETIELANFKARWKKQFYSTKSVVLSGPIIFGLWAYDTVWALAKAVEDSWTLPSPLYTKSPTNDSNPFSHSRLLNNILNSKPIQGLSGEFHIVSGQLEPLPLEIINVVGYGAMVVGFWTPENGFSKSLPSSKIPSSRDSSEKPLWSDISRTLKKLKIAVAMNVGFPGLVQLEVNQTGNEIMFKGYCLDVFRAAVEILPDSVKFEYELLNFPIKGESSVSAAYNKLLNYLHDKEFDAVVGDLTMSADRFLVDFTHPYSDPSIAIVVPRVTKPGIRWLRWYIFFNLKLYFLGLMTVVGAISATLLFLNFILRIQNENAQEENLWHHWRTQMTYIFGESKVDIWCTFLIMALGLLAFLVVNVCSGSYDSLIIVENENEKVDLNSKDVYVGYQFGSIIIEDLLVRKLKIDESRIKGYTTLEDYDLALSKGSARGGVSAVIDETPYLRLFLAKYSSKYKFDGQTYNSLGFSFAFPLDSPLVSYMSKAIIEMKESGKIEEIEHKYFQIQDSMENQFSATKQNQSQFEDFGGLV